MTIKGIFENNSGIDEIGWSKMSVEMCKIISNTDLWNMVNENTTMTTAITFGANGSDITSLFRQKVEKLND